MALPSRETISGLMKTLTADGSSPPANSSGGCSLRRKGQRAEHVGVFSTPLPVGIDDARGLGRRIRARPVDRPRTAARAEQDRRDEDMQLVREACREDAARELGAPL